MDFTQPAIILDAELLAPLCVVQTLGKKNIPVTVVSHDKNAIGFTSKYPSNQILSPVPVNDPAFIEFLISQKERGVIYCGRDYTAEVISRHKDRLIKEGFLLCALDLKDQLNCYDKFSLYKLALSLKIHYPKSLLISEEADIISLENEMPYPYILKPTKADSGLYYLVKSASDNPLKIYRQLKGILEDTSFMHANSQIIAQEFITGSESTQLWNYNALYSKGKAVAEFTGLRLRSPEKPDGSLSSTLLFGRSEENLELKALNQKLLQSIPYEGVVETEWGYYPEKKEYVLFDVNTRISGNIRWPIKGGVDIPYLYYLLCQNEIRETVKQNNGITYHKIIWFNNDLLQAFRVSINNGGSDQNGIKGKLKRLLKDRSAVMKKSASNHPSIHNNRDGKLLKVCKSNLKALLTPKRRAIDVLDFEDMAPSITILKRLISLLTGRIIKKRS